MTSTRKSIALLLAILLLLPLIATGCNNADELDYTEYAAEFYTEARETISDLRDQLNDIPDTTRRMEIKELVDSIAESMDDTRYAIENRLVDEDTAGELVWNAQEVLVSLEEGMRVATERTV